jgi:hypothetical protein
VRQNGIGRILVARKKKRVAGNQSPITLTSGVPMTGLSKAGMMLLTLILSSVCLAASSFAAPVITSVSGTISHNSTVTVTGSGFGSKNHAPPLKWDNFENGIPGSDISSTGYWLNHYGSGDIKFTGSRLRTGFSKRSVVDRMIYSWPRTTPDGNFYHLDVWPYAGKKYLTGYLYIDFVNLNTPVEWQAKLIHVLSGSEHADWPVLALQSWWSPDGQPGNNGSYFEVQYTGGGWPSSWNDWARAGQWLRFEIEWKDSSGPAAGDGFARFSVYHPDEDVVTVTRTGTTMAADGKTISTPHFGYLLVNENNGHEVDTYWDDIYMDDSWSRVEVCNGATYSNRSNCEIQIPSAWTDGQLQFKVNQGGFADDSTAYLYVIDANGCTSAGKQITFAGACGHGDVRIVRTSDYYPTIQDAYNDCANGDTVQLQAVDFNEAQDLEFSHPVAVGIKGGYECDYLTNPGFTTITGMMTIKDGAITLDRIVLR